LFVCLFVCVDEESYFSIFMVPSTITSSSTFPSGAMRCPAACRLLTSLALWPLASAAAPPHICFILADDWGQYNAGYRGDPAAKTPSIDELAGEVSFSQCRDDLFS
jgi:hypothetical protein